MKISRDRLRQIINEEVAMAKEFPPVSESAIEALGLDEESRLGTASSFPPGADTDRDHTTPQDLSPEALDLSVELAQFGLNGDTAQAIIKHLVDKGLLNL
jgi:hypothetical protein